MNPLFVDPPAPALHDRASTLRHQSQLLRHLLIHNDRCRRLWQSRVDRASRQEINSAAVARLLAEWLWDTGQASETEHELPRRLKDLVSRGLRGEQLSRKTLNTFIGAFDLDEETALMLTDPHWRRTEQAA